MMASSTTTSTLPCGRSRVASDGGENRTPTGIGCGAMLSLLSGCRRFHESPSVEAADAVVMPYLLLEMRWCSRAPTAPGYAPDSYCWVIVRAAAWASIG